MSLALSRKYVEMFKLKITNNEDSTSTLKPVHLRAPEDPKEKPHPSRLVRERMERRPGGVQCLSSAQTRLPLHGAGPCWGHPGPVPQPACSWTPTKGSWIEGTCATCGPPPSRTSVPPALFPLLQARDRKVKTSVGWWSHTMERGCHVSAQNKAACSPGASAVDKWVSNQQTSAASETLCDLGSLTRTS